MSDTVLDLEVTGGPWIVRECASASIPNHLSICRADDLSVVIAIIPPDKTGQRNWQDAALLASSKEMLAALTKIYETVNASKDTFHLKDINEPILSATEKIRNEANL